MKTFGVKLPITGVIYVEVEAEDEESAIEKAMQKEVTVDDIETWNTCEHIVRGNVFCGELNEVEAEEI